MITSLRSLVAKFFSFVCAFALLQLLCYDVHGQTTLISWNPASTGSAGSNPYNPGSTATGITSPSSGIRRGSSLSSNGTSGTYGGPCSGGFLGCSCNSTTVTGTAADTNYSYYFTITSSCNTLSLSSIQGATRHSGTGPGLVNVYYALGSATTFSSVGTWTTTATSGTTGTSGSSSLSGFTDLQNIPAGTVVKFIFTPTGGSGTSGTWYFTGSNLSLTGTITAVTSPTVTTSPSASTVSAGSNTYFVASGVTGATSYQWQRNTSGTSGGTWVNISSSGMDGGSIYSGYSATSTASSDTLFLTGVTTTINGYGYRCVASNCAGSTNSSTALLTVTSSTCSGAPTAGTTSAVTSSFCGSGSTTINLSGGTSASDLTYQWQSSSTGATGSFSDIPGATSSFYNTSTISSTTYYRCYVTCPSAGLTDTSSNATVTINSTPTVAATGGDVCSGTSGLTMTASGASTYTWAPSTGLSATTGASVTATSTVTTTYTVTGTTSAGCSSTQTVTAAYHVTPGSITLSPSSLGLCSGGAVTMLSGSLGAASPATGSNSTSAAIATGSGTTSSISISSIPTGATVTGVSVTFSATQATGAFQSDNLFNLKAPNGKIINLDNFKGCSCAAAFSSVNFTSTASTALTTTTIGSGPYAASLASGVGPTANTSNTTTWADLYSVPDGSWTLVGLNNFSSTETTLTGWSISISYTLPAFTWSPTTNLYTNSAGTTGYTGAMLDTVYDNPGTTGAITYTVTAANGSCSSSANLTVTVNPLPSAISGTASVCAGSTTTLTDASSGGTWSSSDNTIATVGSSSGIVGGVAAGTATISYTLFTGCLATAIVTVNPLPSAVSGTLSVCAGSTTTVTDATGSGTWSSGTIGVATIDPSSGVVSGVAGGTTTISYTLATGCMATVVETVIGLPTAGTISGLSTVSIGSTITLSDATSGGVWSSTVTSVATIGSTSGIVSGVAAGTTVISYTVTNSCGSAAATATVNAVYTFLPGNLVVLREGDGSAALGSTGTAIYLIEYNASGSTTGMSVALPSSGTPKITNSGSATSEGQITLSAERDRIIVPGYDASAGTTGVAGTTSSSVNRELFAVTSDGSYSKVASTGSFYSGNNIRSGTASSTNYFGAGPTTGMSYLGTGTAAQLTTTVTNTRIVQVYNGQTYFSSSSGTFLGVSKLGSGIPTTSGQTPTLMTPSITSAYGFSISPDGNTMYVADDGAGIFKYTWSGSSFTIASTVTTTAARGLTVDWSGTNPVIYATNTASPTSILKMTDAGTPVTVFTIATAPTNTAYRGIMLSPSCYASVSAVSTNLCSGDSTYIIISGNPTASVSYNINGGSTLTATIGNNGRDTLHTGSLSSSATYNLLSITTTACSSVSLSGSVTVSVNPLPASITGTTSVCGGSATTLSDATSGGTWSSGSTSIATVGSSSGIASGVATGTSVITYMLSTGCKVTTVLTVNTTPTAIAGSSAICSGLAATFSDATSGGTWTSSNTAVATIGSTGTSTTLTAISSGTSVISYTLSSGCAATATITVNSSPSAISGTTTICAGGTATLSDAGTGTWSSSNTSIATMGSSTGVLSGVSAGTATVTYSLGGSCIATASVTINAGVSAITGTATVCPGATTALTDATTGGVWSSSDNTIATAGTSSGIITGVASGTVTISYVVGVGCTTATTVTVNALPSVAAISGATTVYLGSATTLSDATSGGTWSSAATSVATVGSATGVVTGVASGTTTISYTVSNTCSSASATTTVNVPSPFSRGNLIVLRDGDGSSSLSSSATPLYLVEYSTSGSLTGANVALPSTTATTTKITNSGSASSEGQITLSAERDRIVVAGYDAAAGTSSVNGTTSSSVNREVFAVYPDASYAKLAATSSFYSGNNIRSGTASSTNYFSAGPTSGLTYLGSGTAAQLTTTVTNTRIIQIFNGQAYFSSSSGSFLGVSKLGTGIPTTSGQTPTLLTPSITSAYGFSISPDGNTMYVADDGAGIFKYTWSGSSFSLASTVTTTAARGLTVDWSGTSPVIYATNTVTPTSIIKMTDAGGAVTVTTVATAPTNTAFRGIVFSPNCYASVATLSGTLCSGDSTSIVIAGNPTGSVSYNINGGSTLTTTIGSNGYDTISTGGLTSTSTFNLVSITTTACSSVSLTGSVTVTVNPLPSSITGAASVCTGSTTSLTDAGGGAWSSGSTSVATVVSGTGVVTGVASGTSAITYTLSTGCNTTTVVTVNSTPTAISGTALMCAGATAALSDATSGGTWISGNTSIATVGTGSGLVSGVAGGTSTISYVLSTGCLSTSVATVNPLPSSITGTMSVCAGSTTSLTDAGGGTWSSGATSVATIDATNGVVSAVSAGTSNITYTLSTGCQAMAVVTVNALPSSITGTLSVCAGSTTSLTDAGGGSWASGDATVATVTSTGIVTGVGAGTSTISYTLSTGCMTTAVVTVNALPSSITGTMSVCAGSTTSLTDAGGGSWASSDATVATVTGTGVVSGVSAGTSTISYTLPTGCMTTAVVTVNPLPSPITGTLSVCAGSTTSLTDAGGGSWASSDATVATVTSTGIVTGVGAGTSTISYTLPTGCMTTAVVTVNPLPSSIIGTLSVCAGSTTSLTDAGGGTWSSGSTSVATVVSGTGVVTGVAAGTSNITYTLSTGCLSTSVATVNPLPSSITGTMSVCAGSTTSLTDAGGGTWSSGATSVATIDATNGVVSAVSAGTSNITYTLSTGCQAMAVVTVNAIPSSITGTMSVCAGSTTSLTDAGGGSWVSSNTSAATVTGTGVVSGVSAGTSTISYTLPTGCMTTAVVTVNPLPSSIIGTLSVCAGSTTSLTDAGGGSWASSNPSAATVVSGTGVVTGVAAGTSNITYTLSTGCQAMVVVTVNAIPSSITGTMSVCAGSTTSLTDAGGGSWASSDATVATVTGTGVVSGVLAGTSTISYTLPTGCMTTAVVTVNPLPSSIIGTLSVCAGSTTALTDAGGGSWASSNPSAATVVSGTGVVTGVAAGTSNITYTLSTGCQAMVVVTVNALPSSITGTMSVCAGSTASLTDAGGGSWASSNPSAATVVSGSGVVTGVAAGTSNITYTLSTGCQAIAVVTVNALPSSITGTLSVCAGSTTSLTDAGGGTWSSGSTSVATVVSGTGVVTGVAAGTSNITYTLPTGCMTTAVVTVNPLPSSITGTLSICAGSTTSLTDAGGGTWSSGTTSVATVVSGTGVITGVATGTSNITYTLSTGCQAMAVVTVNAIPSSITGTMSVCAGSTTSLTDAGGGTWSSGGTSVATVVSGTGVITGVAAGTSSITYTLSTGCQAMAVVTVNPLPSSITGTMSVCAGSTTSLTDAGSGTWSSGTTSVATVVSGTGIVTGVSAGTSTISYTLPTGCITTAVVTVNTLPSSITGTLFVCAGSTTSLTDAGGGSWASSDAIVATVTGTGVVSGVSAGTSTISYTLPAGCMTIAVVTVNPLPSPITGTLSVCAGSATSLTDVGGGTWSSGTTSVATVVSGTGVVTGVAAGTSNITYTLATGCQATVPVTVNPVPSAISGTTSICIGANTLLTDAGGGAWTSTNTSVATITSSGLVSGVSSGTSLISYTLAGCSATTIVTVVPGPTPVSGITTLCVSSSTILTDASTGGTWSSSNLSVATIGSSSGVLNGVAAGTSVISYTMVAGCVTTTTVSIITTPHAITGSTLVCIGSTTLLNDAGGGTWSSSNTAVATVGASSGVVFGVSGGTSVITYALPCGIVTTVVTVGSIGGAPVITSLSPAIGTPASAVAISGSNFNITPSNNIVYFGATRASVLSGSTTSLNVTVPAGARYAPVSVDNTGCNLVAYSHYPFLPTYNNSAYISGVVNFAPKVDFSGSTQPYGVAIGDIDGDGLADVAVTNVGANTVSVFRNTGSGSPISSSSFAAKVDFPTGSQPYGISIADVDNDGKLDIVVANLASNSVSVLRNTAASGSITTGSLAAKVDFTTGANPIAVAVHDIDGDGKLEIVTANFYSNNISVLHNVGSSGTLTSASFGSSFNFTTGAHPYGVDIADIDGDGKPEVIVTNNTSNTISVFRNTSATGIINSSSLASKVDFSAGSGPYNVAIADIDGDGKVDVVVTNNTAGTVSVFRNNATAGSITTSSLSGRIDFPTGSTPVRAALADVDGDGKVDIAVTNAGSNTISVFRNTATSGIINAASLAAKVDFATGTAPKYVAMADLDGDGKADIAVANLSSNSISVLSNNPLLPIIGTTTVCGSGSATTLSDLVTGGTWSSSNTAIATVGAATGVVTALSGGTSIITYSLGVGRFTVTTVTVTAPAPITGATSVCSGASTTLSNSISGGSWASSDATVATINAVSGVVTGVSTGTVIITYTIGGGCSGTTVVTVNPSPSAVTGTFSLCNGSTTTLTDAGGGRWSSGTPGVAGVGSASGVVTGVSVGTAVITYTVAGCSVMQSVTVNPLPAAISGPAFVCANSVISLADTASGGSWTSGNPSVATIDTVTGVVTGVAAGSSAITYSLPTGCIAMAVVNVRPLPAAIAGAAAVCQGSSTTLSSAPTGGTWSSSDNTIASMGAATGVLSGASGGTAAITYMMPTGCYTTIMVTVNPLPAAISGPMIMCAGSSVSLTDAGGGAWTSGNTSVATVGSGTGIVSGVSAGTAVITYTLPSGCSVTTAVTVNPLPGPITGMSTLCLGGTTSLTDAGGGTWASSNTSVATVGLTTGVVSAGSTGTSTITYTLATGCYTLASVTVNPLPDVITGVMSMCVGSSSSLTDAGSGTWSSGNISIAFVGSSTGIVTGVGAGTAVITYSSGALCYSTAVVTINPLPAAISGAAYVAVGYTASLTDAGAGTWASGTTSVATIGLTTGTAGGVSLGTSVITYTLPTGCLATVTLTVLSPSSIIGPSTVCAGSATTFSGSTTGGTWSSSNTSVATIGSSSGILGGISGGTAVISYTYSSVTSTMTVTVLGAPVITAVSASSAIPTATVTITGTNFNSVASNNIVYFGATKAGVLAASATSLTVVVPAEATYMPVSVNNQGCALAAYARMAFLPVYDNSPYLIGSINFGSRVDFTAGTNPENIAIGDIDGDGKADLIAVNNGANSISIFRNTATSGAITAGSFAAKVDFVTGSAPVGIAVADIDGDGKLDIAVTNNTSNAVSVFRNTATPGSITSGSLASRVDFTTGTNPLSVAIADVDNDGKPDLVTANLYSGTVSVLRNTGVSGSITSGSFAAKVDFTAGSHPYCVAVADIDGDGKREILVVNQSTATLSVFRNTSVIGTINSSSFAAKVDFGTGSQPYSVAVGDIDGDGKPDVVIANNGASTVSVLRNNAISGAITATSLVSRVDFPTGSAPYFVALGDIDGDGKVDVVTSNTTANTVSVLRNTATSGSIATGSLAPKIDFATGAGPKGLAIGDLDGDYIPDLAVANITANTISVLMNSPVLHHAPHGEVMGTAVAICIGSTITLNGSNGEWSSGDERIAKVDNGIVTGIAAGRTTVTFTNDDGSAVEVTPVIVNSLPVAVAITADPGINIAAGQKVAFSAVVSNSGVQAVYQWQVNNVPAPGATAAYFTAGNLSDNDVVACSAATVGCIDRVVTASVRMHVSNTDNNYGLSVSAYLRVVPNPNTGEFDITGSLATTADKDVTIEVTDVLGRVVYRNATVARNGKLNDHVRLDNRLANGMYLLSITSDSGSKVYHVAVEK